MLSNARFLPLGDQAAPDILIGAAHGAHTFRHGRCAEGEDLDAGRGVVAVAVQGGKMRPDRRLQPHAWRSAFLRSERGDDGLMDEAHAVIDDGLDDLLLRAEMVIEARLADADGLSDLAQGGLVVAAAAQQPRGMVEDQPARAAFGGWPYRWRATHRVSSRARRSVKRCCADTGPSSGNAPSRHAVPCLRRGTARRSAHGKTLYE